MRNATEAENIRVNGGMVRNLLQALAPKHSVRHVALVTGLKHYLGPFDRYAQEGSLPETPLREEQPRLDVENFYYAQEDEVYAAAAARRLHLERPPPAHGDRQGRRQPDEHGHHARRLRLDLQGDRPPVPLARLAGAVAGHLGHDRRARAGQAPGLGLRRPRRPGTRRSTSSTATSSAGTGCGRGWRGWFGVEPVGFDGTVHPLEAADGG